MKNIPRYLLLLLLSLCSVSCKKYLDLKPDKSQVIPSSLEDCQALLNHASLNSAFSPSSVEVSADDYYLPLSVWESLDPVIRDSYIWKADGRIESNDWSAPYSSILVANQIIATLDKIKPTSQQLFQWNSIRGSALLLRSSYFYGLAQVFAQPYDVSTASTDLGIPLRLSPSLSDKTSRGTLQETYDRILLDFSEAASLLPDSKPNTDVTRSVAMPVKAAAYAALARVYLVMGNYEKAYENADKSLQKYDVLIDYKDIDPTPYYPIERFNKEVLYDLSASGFIPIIRGFVSPALYGLYSSGDKRKTLYFRNVGEGIYQFNGSYNPGAIFTGLSTNEVYLIRAECLVRKGNISAALDDLNTLRHKRWDNTYIPLNADNADELLRLIITERRRELPFRGSRWTDLRRLNRDPHFAVTLQRNLAGTVYELPPNDLRYTLLIPNEVLQRVNIPQNPR